MKSKNLTLLAALGTTAIVSGTPAAALFGPTCVPVVQNCWCTYLVPCPVVDIQANVATAQIRDTLEESQDVVKKTTKIVTQTTQSTGGDIGGLVAGINSIGFNLDGMLQSQIDDFHGLLEGARDQLASVSSLDQIEGMISGAIDSSEIFTIAESIGLSTQDLEALGVSSSTIQAFTDGAFSANQLLEVSSALGIESDTLQAFGIDSSKIMAVASGDLSPETLLQQAQSAGLSLSALESVGISVDSLASLAGSGNIGDAINLIESTGLGNNPLSGLGISTQQLAGIIDGSVSPEEIGAALQAAGVDPRSIILPTGTGEAVNGLGEIVDGFNTTFNIPVDSIDGLRETLDQAAGMVDQYSSLSAEDAL